MGPSIVRLLLCAPLVSALLAQQERTPLRPLQKQLPEVVLSGAAGHVHTARGHAAIGVVEAQPTLAPWA
jgi:hypothetical protein